MFRFILPAALAVTMAFAAPVFAQSNTAPVDTPGAISAPSVGQVMRSSGPPPSDAGTSGYVGGAPPVAPAAAPVAAAPAQPMAPTGAPADPAVAQAPPALPAGAAPALDPALNPQPPLPPATIDTIAVDPCKNFMTSHAAYVACQDREKKLQRMKDAKAARQKSFEPPPPKEEKKEEKKAETPAAPATPVGGNAPPPAGAGLNVGTPTTPPPAGTKVDTNTGGLVPSK